MALPLLKPLPLQGIIPGIKVGYRCKGHGRSSREKITEGLDGLRDRLKEYSQMGARFAKWRAVIIIADGIPTRGCIEANAHALGTLCRVMPGSWTGACRRAGGAHGWRAYPAAVCEITEEVLPNGFLITLHPTGDAGGHDPEAQHGASWIDLPPARRGERSGHRRTASIRCD